MDHNRIIELFPILYNERCSICIGEFTDRAQAKPCEHNFCFTCIAEWMKVKTVCPLCMRHISSVWHNFTSEGSFDTHSVEFVLSGIRVINSPFNLAEEVLALMEDLGADRLALRTSSIPVVEIDEDDDTSDVSESDSSENGMSEEEDETEPQEHSRTTDEDSTSTQ